MKVGILTWYKAINHGAVLQTYASSKVLEELSAVPVILDYNWQLDIKTNKKETFLRRLKNVSLKKIIWFLHVKSVFKKKKAAFHEFVNQYLNVGAFYHQEKDLDAVYIGSDMVFDIIEGYNPYMYGKDVAADYIFSYAASFGYSSMELLEERNRVDEIKSLLSEFKAIGYRDENTKQMCSQMKLNVPMTENIDPVLCYGFQKELKEWDSGKWKEKNYVLIYAYDSTMNDKETVKEVKAFAREHGCKIISCGYYHSWCDENVPADPREFLEMFQHAKYIVTDTFHGAVFALILHKNFASYIRKNGFKVRYLLEQGRLTGRIVTAHLADVLSKEPDFTTFDNWLAEKKKQSRDFIKENLEKVKKLKA